MNVRYTDEAIGEISNALDYIAPDNPSSAHDVAAAIQQTIALLQAQPLIARIVYQDQVRAFPVDKYPYRIFFQIKARDMVIRNVRHMRREKDYR